MSDTTNILSMTVCNPNQMTAAEGMLYEIAEDLKTAYEKAETLSADFTEAYEGEAVTEVTAFLDNLPAHIYRLNLFYNKMAQFVALTREAFMKNDQAMSQWIAESQKAAGAADGN